jgi:hypothetical protein
LGERENADRIGDDDGQIDVGQAHGFLPRCWALTAVAMSFHPILPRLPQRIVIYMIN